MGGACGAALRWAVLAIWPIGDGVAWSLLGLNVAGSFLLGATLAQQWQHPRQRLLLHDLVGVGFCGGLTTMSTFSVEVAELLQRADYTAAGLYTAVSVVAALIAVAFGAAAAGRPRALALPVEEPAP